MKQPDFEKLAPPIRKRFPLASRDGSGRRRIFFDAGAGTLILDSAARAASDTLLNHSANLGLNAWESKEAMRIVTRARRAVGDLLNADSENCIKTSDTTSSTFFTISQAFSRKLRPGANVVSTEYEHLGHLNVWFELQRRGTIREVRLTKFNPETGELDLEHLDQLVDSKTGLISVTGIANTLGTRTPLAEVRKRAREVGAYFLVDAAHMVPHSPVDVKKLDCDLLVFSGYKFFSTRGCFMYGKEEVLKEVGPTSADASDKITLGNWEMGTIDQSRCAAIGAVVDYLNGVGARSQSYFKDNVEGYSGRRRNLKSAMSLIEAYETKLSQIMLEGYGSTRGLLNIPKVRIYGPKTSSLNAKRCPTFLFNVGSAPADRVAAYLWLRHSIVIRGGHFFSGALGRYGVETALRASLSIYNTPWEVRTFLRALESCSRKFG